MILFPSNINLADKINEEFVQSLHIAPYSGQKNNVVLKEDL